MPVALKEGLAVLDGACTVEEAEPLLQWLRETPDAQVDLGGCTALHAALAQLLLAERPRVVAPPPDPVLAAALASPLAIQVTR
ncbi:hypothetical protein [Roseomonas sp. AR75]|uniref:hypothetical protein n=1 Tax=Roseomonas sp. AR75 TaxID=2562311 RepID=UPI0010C02F73|nr:hypothetical protein [Roseomonas sp. AR75]